MATTPLSSVGYCVARARAVNPHFRESTSSLKSVLTALRSMAASGLSGQGMVDKMAKDLGKIVATTRKNSDAKKYGAILDWVESHCCREDSYVYHWWRALDHEDYLYDEVNKQLDRKNWNIKPLLVKLEYTLMFQHGLMAPSSRDTIIADMKTVFGAGHDLAAFLANGIETLKPVDGAKCPSERDLLPAFTLAVVKLLAFTRGRSLLADLIANLGTKKILLFWGDGFAGFPGKRGPQAPVDATTHSATMHLGPAQKPEQLEQRFRAAGSKAFLDRCSALYKGCTRGTCSDLQLLCLTLPAGLYAWHHVFAGVKPGPVSKSRFANFISPHYCQVYHEGCHWIRTLAGKAFSVKKEHTQAILCPTLITCYENAEEFFNIRGAEHSEGALLREMGYPERLSHLGGVVPSGPAGTDYDANFSMDYGKGDAIKSLAQGLLEYRLLTKEAYDRTYPSYL
ncbi:MAG: hypothetical protein NTW12_11080 [Deltaproteobacteria bacterium]|nr:hypothetical protein [Deltaproteobacteria bacterium]